MLLPQRQERSGKKLRQAWQQLEARNERPLLEVWAVLGVSLTPSPSSWEETASGGTRT